MEFWLYAATTSALLTSLIGCAGGNASPSNVAQLRPQSGTVVWFVEGATNKIGRITMGGAISEFANGLTTNAGLVGITTGPDGNIWVTERTLNRVAKLVY